MTKTRLRELETEIMQYEFDIEREKQRTYTYLTVESIEAYLQSMMFDNPEDIKIRKIIVNIFVREIILYDDRVIITYNFTDTIEPHKIDTETITETERQITSAFSKKSGSYIILSGAPKTKQAPFGACFVFGVDMRFSKPPRVCFCSQKQIRHAAQVALGVKCIEAAFWELFKSSYPHQPPFLIFFRHFSIRLLTNGHIHIIMLA